MLLGYIIDNFFLPTGSHMCPVKTYDLYVSRLDPRLNRLWQQPKLSITWDQEIWYQCQPVGKSKCQDLMPTLYANAGLSKRYTNHCVRSTVLGILDRGKFGARKIMRWSGHKSENSIKSYAHTTTNAEKKEMAEYLNNAAMGQENIPPKDSEKKVAVNSNALASVPNEQPSSSECDMSLRDLLELTPEQEKDLVKDLFTTDMQIPEGPSATNPKPNGNAVVQSVQNLAQPITGVQPKMMFSNSNVTINFNINK